MICKYPFRKETLLVPCGQCLPCRIRKRREWTHRIMLEATQHKDNLFLTLTYRDEELPEGGNLVPRDLQLFIKRLRKKYRQKIRFYAVGEYGEKTERPHYHLAVFGYEPCINGISRYDRSGLACCSTCHAIESAWNKGNILVGSLTTDSAQYIAQYTTKKMTNKDDPRLKGRHPEFARMSNRPGIGLTAMDDVAHSLLSQPGPVEQVPPVLMHGKRIWPLGRYLKENLRKRIGAEKDETFKEQQEKEMQILRDDYLDSPEAIPGLALEYAKTQMMKEHKGKVAKIERRERRNLQEKGKKL